MKWIFAFMVCTAVVFAQSAAEVEREHSRIIALENAWNQATQQKDSAALTMLLAPELVYVEYDGSLMGKAQYMASVQSPLVHPARIASESMTVHFYGDIAVVNGVYRESGAKDGKSYILRERFTDTWIHRNESWMCVASQSTLISH
ncbi:MAG TPA: nuclear transport factor 2 family protein [Candidatus Aquilonibacter sp.]|nr:nuclear transport factor 2 family protein [Candidatus Aquilonibacter sp.]